MRTGNPLNYVDVDEADIMEIVQLAGSAVNGKPENTVFLGLIALALFMRNPGMTGDQLREGVKGASEYIALYTDSIGVTVN